MDDFDFDSILTDIDYVYNDYEIEYNAYMKYLNNRQMVIYTNDYVYLYIYMNMINIIWFNLMTY